MRAKCFFAKIGSVLMDTCKEGINKEKSTDCVYSVGV